MSVFKVLKIKKGLGKLQAQEKIARTHITYSVLDDGGTLLGQTYISHSATEIGDPLPGQMARQLGITLKLWKGIIRCPQGRAEYLQQARQ